MLSMFRSRLRDSLPPLYLIYGRWVGRGQTSERFAIRTQEGGRDLSHPSRPTPNPKRPPVLSVVRLLAEGKPAGDHRTSHLAPRLKKVYSYTSTPRPPLHVLLLLLLLLILLLTAIQFSLYGSNSYTTTDKTNNIHKRNNTKTQYKQYKTQ